MLISVALNDGYNLNVAATLLDKYMCIVLSLALQNYTNYWTDIGDRAKDEVMEKFVMQWEMIEETGMCKNRLKPNIKSKQYNLRIFTKSVQIIVKI